MSTEARAPASPTPVNLDGRVVVIVGEDVPLTLGLSLAVERSGGRPARLRPTPRHGTRGADVIDGEARPVDTSSPGAVVEAFDAVRATLGGVDAVVFAWFPQPASLRVPVAEMSDDHFGAVWEDPMRAALFCFQAAYRHFVQQGAGGRLIAVVPTIGLTGGPRFAASAAAAEGQRVLVKSAARQWGPDGVTANTVVIAPGLLIPDAPNFEQSLAERALGHLGDPETDIGPVVAFLASEASRFLTGSTLFAEGGLWMSAP